MTSRHERVSSDSRHLVEVYPGMTQRQMREYYLYQTEKSLEEWEKIHFPVRNKPPFELSNPGELTFFLSAELAKKIGLRRQVEAFERESKVSTAGVRENQNVICPWDPRYRINEYIFALIAEALSRMVREVHNERMSVLKEVSASSVFLNVGEENVKIIEDIFKMKLPEIIEFVRANPVRIVGGEVRANTDRFIDLVSRIYAGHGMYVFLMDNWENKDSSSIFMWSYLIFLMGLSGGNYFTSSHGAPQKQSDKILSFDGSQYLPHHYELLVRHMWEIMEKIEKAGYTFHLASKDDSHLLRRLTYENTARLYANYLRSGPATAHAIRMVKEASEEGLRLMLDFFGGSGYKTISAILKELDVIPVFEGGFIRAEEDPFFHDIGFTLCRKKDKPHELEVMHLSVDASIPQVIETAGYQQILKDAEPGQVVYNVDPDADRFVAGQVVPLKERSALERLGVCHINISNDMLYAIYSPNQLFLMIADNDMIQAKADGHWDKYDNFDIDTYVSALSWGEWARNNGVPVVRVPVGFKEIAAIERKIEDTLMSCAGEEITVKNELGEEIHLGKHPKLHHAGEESGGKIGGPRAPIYNVLGEFIIAMREKSSGEAAFSAVALQSRLFLESQEMNDPGRKYLHNYLQEIFSRNKIENPMEFRGDIVHYNEAIIDPAELSRAKGEGLRQKDGFNNFFRSIALAYSTGETSKIGRKISIGEVRDLLSQALPGMKETWESLEHIDVWSDGLQMWFRREEKVRDICLRPSGTDAKSKVYFSGKEKEFLKTLHCGNFAGFSPNFSPQFQKLIKI